MYAAIRVRGQVNISPDIKKTLCLLRLERVNHLALASDKHRGMLNKVQAYVTFGEIDEETLALLLEKRGRITGKKRLCKAFLKEKKFNSFSELAKAILVAKVSLKQVGVKPVFRLGPPKKGYERAGIKKGYRVGGALGYRAGDINKLIKRMV